MAGRPKGQPKSGGREAGTPNKLSTTVRQTVLDVFLKLQADDENSLEAFAKKYPKEFYLIASKLIPQEITGAEGAPLIPITKIEIIRTNAGQQGS